MHTSGLKRVLCAALFGTVAMAATANAQSTRWWDKYRPATPPAPPADQAAPSAAAAEPASAAPPRQPQVEGQPLRQPGHGAAPQPRNAYLEAGYNRVALNDELGDETAGGAYLRGSLPISEALYLFGSHGQVSKAWRDGEAFRLDIDIDQTEIGLGHTLDVSARTVFTTELSYVRLSAKAALEIPDLSASISDSLEARKLAFGFRSTPSRRSELWAKAGYIWLEDNLLLEDSPLLILGGQFMFTPTWGLVGEMEAYEDLRYFRLGLRASF